MKQHPADRHVIAPQWRRGAALTRTHPPLGQRVGCLPSTQRAKHGVPINSMSICTQRRPRRPRRSQRVIVVMDLLLAHILVQDATMSPTHRRGGLVAEQLRGRESFHSNVRCVPCQSVLHRDVGALVRPTDWECAMLSEARRGRATTSHKSGRGLWSCIGSSRLMLPDGALRVNLNAWSFTLGTQLKTSGPNPVRLVTIVMPYQCRGLKAASASSIAVRKGVGEASPQDGFGLLREWSCSGCTQRQLHLGEQKRESIVAPESLRMHVKPHGVACSRKAGGEALIVLQQQDFFQPWDVVETWDADAEALPVEHPGEGRQP
eukprot:1712218-Prymnesium_polylepis.3